MRRWSDAARARVWTPERRAAEAARMRAKHAAGKIGALVRINRALVGWERPDYWPRIERKLIELHRAGKRFDEIGAALGVTRNQVAGKVKRLIEAGVLKPRGRVGGHRRVTKAALIAAGVWDGSQGAHKLSRGAAISPIRLRP